MKEELFIQGVSVAVIGYTVVFLSLVGLFIFFTYLAKVLAYFNKPKCSHKNPDDCKEKQQDIITGEVGAAISTALYMYFNEQHDKESGLLTVKKVSRRYSPWNSKVYNVMNNRLN